MFLMICRNFSVVAWWRRSIKCSICCWNAKSATCEVIIYLNIFSLQTYFTSMTSLLSPSLHSSLLQSHNATKYHRKCFTITNTILTTNHRLNFQYYQTLLLFVNSLNLIVTFARMMNLSLSICVIFYNSFAVVTCVILFSYFSFKV